MLRFDGLQEIAQRRRAARGVVLPSEMLVNPATTGWTLRGRNPPIRVPLGRPVGL